MSSVTEIETAINKLSVAEQRIIALHLGERLLDEDYPGQNAAADEGIRFLPQYDSCPTRGEPRGQMLRRQAKTLRRAGRRKASQKRIQSGASALGSLPSSRR